MKLNEAFPSNFIKAADLNGRSVTVTIASVGMEELGTGRDKEDKLVINFVGKEKRFICNKTNAGTIAKLYGDDTDAWIGKPITIVPREVEFQGDMVWAIRVCFQKPAPAQRPPEPQPAAPPDNWQPAGPHDSDVPF